MTCIWYTEMDGTVFYNYELCLKEVLKVAMLPTQRALVGCAPHNIWLIALCLAGAYEKEVFFYKVLQY